MFENFSLFGFAERKIAGTTRAIPLPGTYILQHNPSSLDVQVLGMESAEAKDACGDDQVDSSASGIQKRQMKISFVIDNTGALPYPPTACGFPGMSVYLSILFLKKLCVDPLPEIHQKPTVRAVWGLGSITLYGYVEAFSYKYTYYNKNGIPLRATINLTIKETEDPNVRSLMSYFQSPDITRIPSAKSGDTLVGFCEEYYDNKNYYLKAAEHNNLSSFRKIKPGSILEFPPISY